MNLSLSFSKLFYELPGTLKYLFLTLQGFLEGNAKKNTHFSGMQVTKNFHPDGSEFFQINLFFT